MKKRERERESVKDRRTKSLNFILDIYIINPMNELIRKNINPMNDWLTLGRKVRDLIRLWKLIVSIYALAHRKTYHLLCFFSSRILGIFRDGGQISNWAAKDSPRKLLQQREQSPRNRLWLPVDVALSASELPPMHHICITTTTTTTKAVSLSKP